MTMKRVIISMILMVCVVSLSAQNNRRPDRNIQYQQYQLMKNYTDSLVAYKQRLDSLVSSDESLNEQYGPMLADGRFYRLFAPLTYYQSPAKGALRMAVYTEEEQPDEVNNEIDNVLMNVYLNRPDLVVNSESNLKRVGGVSNDIIVPIQQNVELASENNLPDNLQDDPEVDVVVEKPNFWTIKGDYYLQGLQNYISGNWYKGGESNYSLLGSITMEANYDNKQKVKWDNKLEMKLGFMTSKSDSIHSFKASEDLLRLTSKFGLQATKRWYYTLQMIAYTQFTHGYKSNDRFVYSDFLSPFNLNLSLGMDYNVEACNKKLTGTIHLAPFAYNFKYVERSPLAKRNGLEEGKHTLHDFGSQFTVDLKWAFSDNIQWQTRLYGFTTYSRTEMEWENTFTFQFNKYISTKLFVYPRFDDCTGRDDHHGYWQFKEFFSLGFSYTF